MRNIHKHYVDNQQEKAQVVLAQKGLLTDLLNNYSVELNVAQEQHVHMMSQIHENMESLVIHVNLRTKTSPQPLHNEERKNPVPATLWYSSESLRPVPFETN